MHKKVKGSIAELQVASYLTSNGWRVLFPYGENNRYDLVGEKDGLFVRFQVKYVTPKNGGLDINCSSSNNWSVLPYNSTEIDYLAVFNPIDKEVYFIHINKITKYKFKLRLSKAKNNQVEGVHLAEDYKSISI